VRAASARVAGATAAAASFDAARAGDTLALEALRLIRPLFEVEKQSQLAGDNALQRKARRAEHSAPALEKPRAWLEKYKGIIPPTSTLGRALGYLHRQWLRLGKPNTSSTQLGDHGRHIRRVATLGETQP
jgi:hypothetical protein